MLLLLATAACAGCHEEIVKSWARTPMANSSGVVRAAGEFAGSVPRHNLAIEPGEKLRLRWAGGIVDLTLFIGSRRMGRSYAFEYRGSLFQAPVGYYANRKMWDSPPGYENDPAPDFTRPITAECLYCHATRAGSEPVHGVQCERCHGGGVHEALVNPRKLKTRSRDSVCEQCHLAGEVRLARAGRRVEEYQPGRALEDFVEVFVAPGRQGIRVNGHAESMARSRCKQAAPDRLWCGTCHNPHKPAPDYDAVCLSCHTVGHRTAKVEAGSCAACHMPKGRAVDGGHTVFTDHNVGGGREPGGLASYFGRKPASRDLGLAYAQLGAARRDAELLDRAWPLLRDAASQRSRDPVLYTAIASLLAAGGRRREAIAYYRISLDQDGRQPDTLRKLADLVGGVEAKALRERALRLLPRPFE